MQINLTIFDVVICWEGYNYMKNIIEYIYY